MKSAMKLAVSLAVAVTFVAHAETQYTYCQATDYDLRITYIGDIMIDDEYVYKKVFANYMKRNHSFYADNINDSQDYWCSSKRGSAGLDSIKRDRIEWILLQIGHNYRIREIHAYDLINFE